MLLSVLHPWSGNTFWYIDRLSRKMHLAVEVKPGFFKCFRNYLRMWRDNLTKHRVSSGLWQRRSASAPGSATILLDNLHAVVSSLCLTFTTWEVKIMMLSFLQSALRFMEKEYCVRAWNLLLMKSISFLHTLSSLLF